jgi:cell division protein FtsQ
MSAPPVKAGRRVVAAIAGGVVAALIAWAAWYGYSEVASQPIRHVAFAGDANRLDPEDLARLEQWVLATPAASMDAIRSAARQVAWVREATVRRAYPDTVEVRLEAHTAFARWNDNDLVSDRGAVFAAKDPGTLPRLRGPDGSAPRLVAEFPAVIAELAPLGSPVRELTLTARGGWTAVLDTGLAIALGRGDWKPRAQRLVAAWPKLPEEMRAAEYADLRYPGGFALKRVAAMTISAPCCSTPAPKGTPGRGNKP